MKIGNWFSLFDKNHVELGGGYVDRTAIIEIKYLFSIYLNVWNTLEQDRFHNHAFNSVSFMLRGWYYEEEYRSNWPIMIRALRARFIDRNYMHRILRSSPNAISLTLAGPWAKTWREVWPDGTREKHLGWGREVRCDHRNSKLDGKVESTCISCGVKLS